MSSPFSIPVVARAFALCAAGAALGLGSTAVRTGGWPRLPNAPTASCEGPAVEPTVLPAREAAGVCAKDRALVADARSDAEYAAGHIAGAIHLSCDTRGDVASAALAKLGDRALVLVYGATTADALTVARSIAQRLPPGGGPKIYALAGGFEAWEQAGLACASGPCEGCVARPMSR